MRKLATGLALAALLGLAACGDSEPNEFAGTWKVADTGGQVFDITLGADGVAKASRAGEGMSGTWKKDGNSAVITWDTGWTTKINKEGDKFTKVAYEKGGESGAPKNTSTAEKVK
jgi:predicted small lipoprotein YifL